MRSLGPREKQSTPRLERKCRLSQTYITSVIWNASTLELTCDQASLFFSPRNSLCLEKSPRSGGRRTRESDENGAYRLLKIRIPFRLAPLPWWLWTDYKTAIGGERESEEWSYPCVVYCNRTRASGMWRELSGRKGRIFARRSRRIFVARLSARLARRVFSSSPGAYSQKSHRPSLSEQYF